MSREVIGGPRAPRRIFRAGMVAGTLLLAGCGADRFQNADGSGHASFADALKWKVGGPRRVAPDTAPVPAVAADLARLAVPPGPGEGVRLTWIGHASFLVQLEGLSFLIDPVFGDLPALGPRRNVAPGVPLDQLPPIAAVLVSHNHFDHLELSTLVHLGAPVVAGLGTGELLRGEGLVARELQWWESLELGRVRITFVPARHWSRRGLFDSNDMLWGGFVLEGGSARVYHSGDTAYFAGFAEIGRRFPRLDAALLPIGAYDPAWLMEKAHMGPEQATQAFVDLGARTFVAMHWGTFKLSDEPLDEPPVRLAAEWERRGLAPETRRVLAVGETLETITLGGAAAPPLPPE